MPESSDDHNSSGLQDDKDVCESILKEINITIADDVIVHRIGRAGHENRPRPLKLNCKSIEQKIMILRKARELRSHQKYRDVFINPDRTQMQRAIHKKLREELNRRRSNGEDVVIFRDRVVVRRNNRNF